MKKICVLLCAFFFLNTNFVPKAFAQEESSAQQVVYIIAIKGEIFDGLARRVSQKLKRVDREKTRALILDIDTPGGGVGYVIELCKQIDALAQQNIPVYAYITGYAWSGGALISLACDKIYMRQQASIGSAQVKILTPLGVKDADEKSMSAMRSHFRAYAEHRNYPKALAEAMVDPSIEVEEILYRGERFFKTSEDLLKMRNEPTINPEHIVSKGIVVPSGKLANFTASEAKNYGFCRDIYQSREELLRGVELDGLKVIEVETTSSDALANFLTNKWVRFFLIAFGVLGIVIEFWVPGFGIPGIVGLTCFILFFVGGYLAEVTAIWEIILFILGLMLLAVELFVLPGFGIAGVTGLICCFVAMLLSLQAFVIPRTEEESYLFLIDLITLTLGIGVDVFALMLLYKFLPESAPLQRLSVTTVQSVEDGYSVAIPSLEKLVGKEGVTASPLRPAGRIEINGEFYDVATEGDFIESGERVAVMEVQGNRIIVERARVE